MAAKQLFKGFQEARRTKSLLSQIRSYRRFVPVHFETDDFLVTTAESGPQLLKVLQLRHEVFIQEWQGRRAHHGLDVDSYDFQADHLVIFDKRISEPIGTYRLLSSHFTHEFYSASEFSLNGFQRLPSTKLELGRACTHAHYRNGNTIDLLWKGLSQYIMKTKTEFLFGCSSVKTTSAASVGRLYQTLHQQGSWSDDFMIRPTFDYILPGFSMDYHAPLSMAERRDLIPPILRSYLHAGATVYGYPALDRDFACVDLLTILDWKNLNKRFKSRFTCS